MDAGKDIRFSEKKIDESWKSEVTKDKGPKKNPSKNREPRVEAEASSHFITLISSLGMQALIQLGEVEDPVTKMPSPDLEAAKMSIDLLATLKEKTSGNLTAQEEKLLDSLLFDLQMKFVKQVPH